MRLLVFPFLFPLALAGATITASPADRLSEAEGLLLEDPPAALSLCAEAVEALPADSRLVWQGEELKLEQVREQVEKFTAAYAATRERLSYASFCLAQLTGPDRITLALQLARRHVREGRAEEALALAEEEQLAGEARIRLLMTLAGHFQSTGEADRVKETMAEIMAIYPELHAWVQKLVKVDVADCLVTTGRLIDLVSLAHELPGWRQPYYFSHAAEVFPNWDPVTLINQSLGLAQRLEPAQMAPAFVILASSLVAAGQKERADTLIESSREIAATLEGKDKVVAFAALAELSARREREEEAAGHVAAAIEAIMEEMEGWEQTDALLEFAGRLAGTAAAPFAGPQVEEASVRLSATAAEVPLRNKYRVYEFRGVAAVASPSDEYTEDERRALFAELIRLEEMPDAEREIAAE